MGTAYLDWAGLALVFGVLGGLAYGFSRRTLRVAMLVTIVAGVLMVTRAGLAIDGSHPGNFADVFLAGENRLVQVMFSPVIPAGPRPVPPGVAGWATLLVLLAAGFAALDTLCARREQPRVQVADPRSEPGGAPEPGRPYPGDQRALLEELKFRLPAVEVRKPAMMPGGSTLDTLASLISDSGGAGAKATAALMQAVHALEAQPRIYEVRVYSERCSADGHRQPDGDWLHITVDLRNARTGQNVVVRTLPPCPPDEAADQVAGFTARQVFMDDHSTPAWAVGSADGQDLSAYLLAAGISPRSGTFPDVYACRQRQRSLLEQTVRQSRNAGLIQYELAAMCDIDGDNLESLLLHLDNRVRHPRLLRGRYRLAMSLSAIADPLFESQWRVPKTSAGREAENRTARKEEIIRRLGWAGLVGGLDEPETAELLRDPDPAGDREQAVKLIFLTMARREFCAYHRSARVAWLLWSALRHRSERRLRLEMLRARPGWLHPHRRMLVWDVTLEVINQRLNRLRAPASADALLAAAQQRVLRRLGLHKAPRAGAPWVYGRVPWQAVYSAACLCALRRSSGQPDPGSAETAVQLLRLAVGDPDCELARPSEWIAMDPDLRSLRGVTSFDAFVREQARWDFAPSPASTVGDPWFRRHLPGIADGAAATDPAAPAHAPRSRPAREAPDPAALVPSPAPPVQPPPGLPPARAAAPTDAPADAPTDQAATSGESKRKPRHRVS
jgi:hypothetical protein